MSLQDVLNLQIRRMAEDRGWRMVDDDRVYFEGYIIQRKRRFLCIPYWTDEYHCKTKEKAIATLQEKAL